MIERTPEANARRYPWYAALYSAFFWMPIFFLFFAEFVSLGRVLTLEAIYYAGVVCLEVPSGYVSDAVGRRGTLAVSALSLTVGYATFALGDGFLEFALAQGFLAGGIALHSGSATALHFDTLSALGREDDYEDREAVAERWSLVASACAAAVGGLAGTWNLRAAYVLSALAAVGALAVTLSFVEPSPESDADGRSGALRIDRQLWACLGDLRQPSLAWAFGFAILATVLNHVPYEFYQPYLDLLVSGTGFDGKAPAATGLHMAIGTGIGAWVAGHSAAVSRRIGRQWTLMGALALQVCIIATMGTVLHVVVAGLILLRGVPSALAAAPLRAAVTPRVPESRRATFLSLQSLVGRLAFAATLTLLGWYAGSADPDNWPALASLLRAGAAVGVVGLALLLLLRPAETSESE